MVVTDRILICLVDPTPDFRPAELFTLHADLLSTGGTDAALRELVTAVVNTYENVVQWLEEQSDAVGDQLFALEPLSRSEQLRAFRLRTVLPAPAGHRPHADRHDGRRRPTRRCPPRARRRPGPRRTGAAG